MSSSEITASQILTKGLQSDLNSTDIEDGKLRFTTDTGRLYLDIGTTDRVLISEYVSIYTEQQIFDLLAPLPKIYISSDTHRAYVSTGLEWIDLAAVKLSVAASANTDKPLWFSATTDEQPIYDSDLTYNTYSDTLKTPNLEVSNTAYIGNMRITNTLNQDQTSHTVLIDFVSS